MYFTGEKGHKSIIKALDAVGGFHLEGLRLRKNEQQFFNQIKHLVNSGELMKAEEISKDF